MSRSGTDGAHLSLVAHTQPGFEAIGASEIAKRVRGSVVRGTRRVADKNGLVFFDGPPGTRDLSALRTVEDLFVLVANTPDPPASREELRRLGAMAAGAEVGPALTLAGRMVGKREGRGGVRFRVVTRLVGRSGYRRPEAQNAVERGVLARADRRWRLVEDGGLELWLTILPDRVLLAVRITDASTRHREYLREHLPASLRPSAAAAMVWLTNPRPDDLFLDPMCGAGTLLIERACAGRYRMILGGDIRDEAVSAALGNIGPRYKPIEVRRWDARNLPLDEGSVDAAAVNLPFGRRVGTPDENRSLYPAFLGEAVRVLRPGARLVVLTGDTRTFGRAMEATPGLARRETHRVQILGRPAGIYVMERL